MAEVNHRLSRLLAPTSVALVGATTKPNVAGNDMVLELQLSKFKGAIYPVNPLYEEVEGLPCYRSLLDLPDTPDLVVLGVSNQQLEEQVREAIDIGAGGLVIFGSALLQVEAGGKTLRQRIADMAREANLPIVGGNCMGFYNMDHAVRAFPFHKPYELKEGGVTLIAQSGSVLTALLWNDQKLRFNLAVSPGHELVTTVADYMDYALHQPTTTVIAIFLEAVRDPEAFIAALQRAVKQQIPVIILKAGRTPEGAQLAKSHSGAIAGDNAAYQALFERYGVISVQSLDELASTALLLSSGRLPAQGGLASIFDSGGERELLVDLAHDVGVPMARIGDDTVEVLKENLDHGLEPINPLDAWGTGRNYQAIFENCWQALMDDPDTAMGVFVADLTSGFYLHESFARICRRVARRTQKPVAMLTNHIGTDSQDLATRTTDAGVPVLDGTLTGLKAVKHAMNYRDFINRPKAEQPPTPDPAVTLKWRNRLARAEMLTEAEGLDMLTDFGIPTAPYGCASSLNEAQTVAATIGYPVVIKTAMPGILHKSDVGGVHVNVADQMALDAIYQDLDTRLGPDVLIAKMVPIQLELALGIVVDQQFGPVIMVAGGGVFIEIYKDRRLCLAPVNRVAAEEMVDQLAIKPILDGARGRPVLDRNGVVEAIMALSSLATAVGDLLSEFDVNPLAVTSEGCIALDALAVPAAVTLAASVQPVTTKSQRKRAMGDTFNALVLRQEADTINAEIEELDNDDLPPGDVIVKVDYSSLNYKDGMALTGKGNIIRSYPMVPGIDLVGSVLASDSEKFLPGDPVILTGWSVGERYWGGFTQRQRTHADWLVRLPAALDARDAMGLGTAGLTAMLCVMAIEEGGIRPEDGPVVVTGAAGGVGSVAVALLAGRGYEVTAVTGRADTHDYLQQLGASRFLSRREMTDKAKPLETETWAAAVDTVGSTMLTKVLAQTRYRGVVAACGLAGGAGLQATVMPFILRGVRLQGIDSVMAPVTLRERAWEQLASELNFALLHTMMTEVGLSEVLSLAPKILAGQVRGRVVVNTHL